MAHFSRKRVGVLGFPGVTALDLTGPAEAFAVATVTDAKGERRPCYEVVMIGIDPAPFTSESGITFLPKTTLRTCGAIDTLIVPGGFGLREPATNAHIANWILRRAKRSAGSRRSARAFTGSRRPACSTDGV